MPLIGPSQASGAPGMEAKGAGPPALGGPLNLDQGLSMAYYEAAQNFRTGENFDFYVTSSKVSKIELYSCQNKVTVL